MKEIPTPRRWSNDELEAARLLAIADFVTGRTEEGGESYVAILAQAVSEVEQLFVATDDLAALGEGEALIENAGLLSALRYTAGPPISDDDLKVMANVGERSRRYPADEAGRIARLLWLARDRYRFPWLDPTPPRRPDDVERRVAITATASLMAAQRIATKRRNESSARQEAATKAFLRQAGFEEVATRPINSPDDLLRSQFCAASMVANNKSDITLRLRDGRLLVIECKVSSSPANSIKRLGDVGNKADTWRRAFGNLAITMAVIAGVFKLINLANAQNNKDIALVWERDFAPLGEFLERAV